jgi:2-polyprenyl-3-methyl-5-hydroxy-6-metoxy-1,4-benzoquinol methylase
MVTPSSHTDDKKDLYKNYYKHHFSRFANAPDRETFDIHVARYAWNFDRHLSKMDKNKPVLEIGCGVGQFIYYLQQRGFQNIHGIDLGEDQISQANIFFDQVKIPENIKPNLQVADAISYLTEHQNEFQFIVMNDVIEHIPHDDVINLLQYCYDALIENGLILVKTPNMDCPLGLTMRYRDFTHTTGFTNTSMKFALGMSGFVDTQIYGEEAPVLSWKQAVKRKVFNRGMENLLKFAYFCLDMIPIPPTLSQWLIAVARAMGQKARKTVEATYSVEVCLPQLHQMLLGLIASHGPP